MRRLNVKLHHIRVKSQEQSNQDKIPKYACQNDKVQNTKYKKMQFKKSNENHDSIISE